MKKVKYRNNNNNYNNQVYSINYKFDSISPAGKCSGTALDLIKRYNELAKEAHGNGNYVEAEVFRQYAEHYRKIITEINERKNIRFNTKENETAPIPENNKQETLTAAADITAQPEESNVQESSLVETKAKKSFTVIEVTDETAKPKKTYKPRPKKETADSAANQ